MEIRVLQSVAGIDFAYGKGYEGDIPDHIALDLIGAGLAVGLEKRRVEHTTETASVKPSKEKRKA